MNETPLNPLERLFCAIAVFGILYPMFVLIPSYLLGVVVGQSLDQGRVEMFGLGFLPLVAGGGLVMARFFLRACLPKLAAAFWALPPLVVGMTVLGFIGIGEGLVAVLFWVAGASMLACLPLAYIGDLTGNGRWS